MNRTASLWTLIFLSLRNLAISPSTSSIFFLFFFAPASRITPGDRDSLAEGSEFELPVLIYEQSDDSIRLSLVTSRRNCKALLPRSALLVRFRRVTH